MWEFLQKLFDTSDFPARWHCGYWTPGHGWLYIVSDLAIFGAYTAIPILLASFVLRRRDAPFPRIFWLFVSFILACGLTHLMDAVIFWQPMYRLSAVIRLLTAVVSWATVAALIPTIPMALSLRTPHDLEVEVAARTAELREVQRRLQEAHDTLERRVEERTAALRTSNEDLQQFAYIIAHDLQEPMRMVASFTQLLQEEYGDQLGAEGQEYIRYAGEGATRMQAQLRSVLEYSRVQTQGAPFAEASLEEALHHAVEALRLSIQESGAVLHTAPHPLPVVRGDLHQLSLVLQNLLGNAIKFAREDQPPEITITAQALPDAWRISVRDNGIGFDMAHADRIFQIFQRLHPAREVPGSGVGLAICKRIVSRHGGQISAASAPGEGSEFAFTLPFSPPEEAG